jgi:CRP-like cAMP-binding protein
MSLFVARLIERSPLSGEERQSLLDLPCHKFDILRRRDIVPLDQAPSSAFVVASGLVGRYVQMADGSRQFTSFHLPGDMVDLHSTVRAVGLGGLNALCNTTIVRVSHSDLRDLAGRYPAIAEAFWRDCMLDAAVLMQWTINAGRRDARGRLAHLLCELAIRTGPDRSVQMQFDLPLTQEQIADASALTSVHVNRSLKGMESLATVKHGRVTIRDWEALVQAGEFSPAYLLADTVQKERTPAAA